MGPAVLASVTIGFATLRQNPLRTALSTLGIVVGAAALVAVLAVGDGLERFGRQQLAETTDLQSVVIQPRTSQIIDGQNFPLDSYPVFTRADAESLLARLPEVRGAALTLSGESPIYSATDSSRVLVVATLPTAADVMRMTLVAGRYFTPQEAQANAAVVILSYDLAARLTGGPASAAVGDAIRLRLRERTIIGVLRARPGERSGLAYVPLEAQADALAPTPRPRAPSLVLQARSMEEVGAVQRAADGWLRGRYGDWERVARVVSNQARVAQAAQAMLVFKLFMGAITGISLLVGGIGIMNVLLASVVERTREIGVRKAVGASQGNVLVQFLSESIAIAGLGSIAGSALGLGGAFGITALIRARSQAQVYAAFSWSTLGVAAAAALVVGTAFGMYPALRAARLPPIDAIRHE